MIALFLPLMALTSGQGEPNPAEAYIRSCVQVWNAASETSERQKLPDCFAADFVQYSLGGIARGKAETLARAMKPTTGVAKSEIVDLKVRFVSPGVATDQGWIRTVGKDGTIEWLTFLDVWLLRDGRWQIAVSHSGYWPNEEQTAALNAKTNAETAKGKQ